VLPPMAPTKNFGRQKQIVLVTGTAMCCLLLANASMLLRSSREKPASAERRVQLPVRPRRRLHLLHYITSLHARTHARTHTHTNTRARTHTHTDAQRHTETHRDRDRDRDTHTHFAARRVLDPKPRGISRTWRRTWYKTGHDT